MREGSSIAKEWERLKALDSRTRAYQFETFIGTLFGQAHFAVTPSPGAGGSRQVDLLATLGDEIYLVEAKWWTKKKPGEPEVAALEDRLKQTPQKVLGILVSYSGFTQGAIDRVERKPQRPILLVTGVELEHAVGWSGDFLRMVRQKRDAMLIHSKTVFMSSRPLRRPVRRKNKLPSSAETIVFRDGSRSQWLTCEGDFGQFAFVRELPDIDWAPGSGFGVTLDVQALATDQSGLLSLLRELSAIGWITEQSRWSIQQAENCWHGAGAEAFAEQLADWKTRYDGIRTIHHTEEFCYVDTCDELGFYSLTGQVAAHVPRTVWRTSLSFQLSGVPVDVGPLQALCDRFDTSSKLYFRPRSSDSVTRHHLGVSESVPLDVVGFVVEGDELETDPDDREWAVGVVAKNPFRHTSKPRRKNPDWWPDMASDTELIVCALRSWHPLKSPKKTYRLWSCESAWTSDALVLRPLADWDDDQDGEIVAPRLLARRDKPPKSIASLVEP